MGLVKSTSSHPEDLASGRVVAPDEAFDRSELDFDDPHDQRLVDEGILIDAKVTPDKDLEGEALQERARELDIEGRSAMSAAKLRKAVAEAEARQPDTTGGDSA